MANLHILRICISSGSGLLSDITLVSVVVSSDTEIGSDTSADVAMLGSLLHEVSKSAERNVI